MTPNPTTGLVETNYVPNTVVTEIVKQVRATEPAGTNPLLDAVLGVATLAASAAAVYKNSQHKKVQAKLNKLIDDRA
jgi:hypothetical protein